MNRPSPRLHWHAPAARVRVLQGKFEVMLADARRDRAATTDLAERVALSGVIHQVEDWIAMCREHLAAVRCRTGWGHPAPPGAAHRRSASPLPVHPSGVMPRRASAGLVAGRLGVAGATPPPVMGHGWPASPRAGSAAARPARSENAPPVGQEADARPAEPAFFGPPDERISKENNTVGGIHYANYDWA